MLDKKLLFSKDESAQVLGVCLQTINHLISRGELRVRRLGRRVLIPRSEVERFAGIKAAPATKCKKNLGPDVSRAWKETTISLTCQLYKKRSLKKRLQLWGLPKNPTLCVVAAKNRRQPRRCSPG